MRAVGRVPRGQHTAVTLLATLTATGFGSGYQVPGAVDRPTFEALVERLLVPAPIPGQTVVLDNLSAPTSARAKPVIEAAGCRWVFVPTYSPDFHPIEQAFAKRTHRLRQVEARPLDAIMTTTQATTPTIASADARSYDRDAGYNL